MEEVLSHGRASLVAERLRDRADRLEHEQANPFRVFAYRRAADTIAMLGTQFDEIVVREGAAGLTRLPGVGPRIAAAISRILGTGLTDEPSVAVILDVDAEYRRKAAARLLPRIAPRRFNRTRDARLPGASHPARGMGLHGPLFEHRARPPASANPGLGRDLLPPRPRTRAPTDRRHGDAGPARRSPRGAGPGVRVDRPCHRNDCTCVIDGRTSAHRAGLLSLRPRIVAAGRPRR
jgi:hypothetical protein